MKKFGNISCVLTLVLLFLLAGVLQFHHHHHHDSTDAEGVCRVLPWQEECHHHCDNPVRDGSAAPYSKGACGFHLSDYDVNPTRMDYTAVVASVLDWDMVLPHDVLDSCCHCAVCVSRLRNPKEIVGRLTPPETGGRHLRAPPACVIC